MHQAADAKRTIAVLSPDYLKSEYTAPEWAAAVAGDPTGAKRKLVPVRVRACQPTGILAQVVHIDLVNLDEAAAKQALLQGVKRTRAKPSAPPPFPGKSSATPPPFPGKQPATRAATRATRGATRSADPLRTAAEVTARLDQLHWGIRSDRGRSWTGDV